MDSRRELDVRIVQHTHNHGGYGSFKTDPTIRLKGVPKYLSVNEAQELINRLTWAVRTVRGD